MKVLNGWIYNAPDQSLDIGPVLNPNNCHGPWICSKAYGTLGQVINDKTQTVTMNGKDGELTLLQLNVRSRIGQATQVSVTQDGTALATNFVQVEDQVRIKFSISMHLKAGSQLIVKLAE